MSLMPLSVSLIIQGGLENFVKILLLLAKERSFSLWSVNFRC
jgi:hypothetical protein